MKQAGQILTPKGMAISEQLPIKLKFKQMKNILLILSLFFIISCDKKNEIITEFQPFEISFVSISKSGLYGAGAEGIVDSNILIKNNSEWQNLINQMDSVNNVSDSFSEIDIDFDKYMIIAIFVGMGANIIIVEITSIIENETNITVLKQEIETISSVVTQPYHIVKIPISDKTIVFE